LADDWAASRVAVKAALTAEPLVGSRAVGLDGLKAATTAPRTADSSAASRAVTTGDQTADVSAGKKATLWDD